MLLVLVILIGAPIESTIIYAPASTKGAKLSEYVVPKIPAQTTGTTNATEKNEWDSKEKKVKLTR